MGNSLSNKSQRDYITREELVNFKEQIMKETQLKYTSDLIQKDMKIAELERNISILSSLNRELETKNSINTKDETSIDMPSDQQIQKFVEELLNDENVNIGYLPDWVERKLYVNVFNILLSVIKRAVKTTSISFIGHQIKLDMKPVQE